MKNFSKKLVERKRKGILANNTSINSNVMGGSGASGNLLNGSDLSDLHINNNNNPLRSPKNVGAENILDLGGFMGSNKPNIDGGGHSSPGKLRIKLNV